jgi:phage terminase large subunit-like protein
LTDLKNKIREEAETDLASFIRLVHPGRILGGVHKELILWWTREGAGSHQMTLLPRDHGKSAMVAYRAAWEITKNPAIRILYISATSNLAEKQLGFIKQILTSPIYTKYWPEMVHPDAGKRERWTNSEIIVDHPIRKKEAIRDATVFTGGLTTSLTGLHCDIAILDDVVVQENAYTQEGRDKVSSQYSLLSSIEGAEASEWVVGTRYHPKDLYQHLLSVKVEIFDTDGDIEKEDPLYEVFERQVESMGDGTGEFIWPRQQRPDGKSFGFNQAILAKKRAQYIDKTQFRAQYYNDPNDTSSSFINPDFFQYYERERLTRTNGRWTYNGNRLNVFAAIDFAYTVRLKSDYSAIAVLGVDGKGNYYVLDLVRFKSAQISEYFKNILQLHQKWDFRKIRCETTAAQSVIVEDLKENYIKRHGLSLAVEHHKPNRHEGTKVERMEAILQPRYANLQVWHYRGGNCELLEEELVKQNPAHDDLKDALASCLEICVAPSFGSTVNTAQQLYQKSFSNSRFGGVAF